MLNLKEKFILFCSLLLLSNVASSLHIIGGEITYECLGNNQYLFNMTVYRDCSGNGAQLDNPASITTFQFNGGSPSVIATDQIVLDSVVSIPPIVSNPCLTPPSNLCVEKGSYSWISNLPLNPDGYVIAYQRCCRNSTINNIATPDAVGGTYTATISNVVQTTCNSSPVFNDFPPIVICANEPINFDHSASDPDGNTLVYSFCDPTVGASNNNPAPQVASNPTANYPHYPPVVFIGGYTTTTPMAGVPVVSIDPTTGVITGTPTSVGQFVVGVCVEEFDAQGNLIATTRRDFQFNVTNCILNVFADVLEDSIISQNEYLIVSCGEETVTFINQSGQPANIFGYFWEFDLGPSVPVFTSTATNPTVTFPGVGSYIGTLVVNPGAPSCSDTAFIYIDIFPEIVANYSFSYDTCILGPVTFVDSSYTGSGAITNWNWDFGDGNSSTTQHPVHQYTNAGTYQVTLTVRDSTGCEDMFTQTVTWYPESAINVALADSSGCAPFTAVFTNNSFPIAGYTVLWDLGDGNTSTAPSPTHTYPNPGTYSVTITITSPIGCVSQQVFPNLITVYEVPIVTTMIVDTLPCAGYCVATAIGSGTLGQAPYSYEWPSGQTTALATGLCSGTYNVTLLDANGCTDNTSITITDPPDLIAEDFTFVYDSCKFTPVFFTDQSMSANGPILAWHWDFGDGDTSIIQNPSHQYANAGVYTVTLVVTDVTGCLDTHTELINWFPESAINVSLSNNQGCEPLTVIFTNNSFPITGYTTDWDLGDGSTSTDPSPTHVYDSAGVYTVVITITSPIGCVSTQTFSNIITIHPTPLGSANLIMGLSCPGSCSASASATGSGTIPPYSFEWSDGQTSAIATGLCAGQSMVTITDGNGCQDTVSVFVPNLPGLTGSYDISTVSCYSFCDGSISLTVSNGTPPYIYTWSNGQQTQMISGLCPGSFDVSIVDANGCEFIMPSSALITEPDTLGLSLVAQDPNCFQNADGQIVATVTGGTVPYQYSWTDGQTTATSSQLPGGYFEVTVSDANGCQIVAGDSLFSPPPIIPLLVSPYLICYGSSDGVVAVDTVLSGNPPFTYSLDGVNFQVDSFFTGLPSATHTVTVLDQVGCTGTATQFVDQRPELVSFINATLTEVCLGETTEFEVFTNSFGLFTYEWSPSGTLSCFDCKDPVALPLATTTYTVTVTDENGCTSTANITIEVDPKRRVWVPNIFTPNADGINDNVTVFGDNSVDNILTFRVYDRWGSLVFNAVGIEANKLNQGWDGRFKGEPMNPGVFVYYTEILFIDGSKKELKGDISLIR